MGASSALADLQLFRRHSEVDLNAPIDDPHRVGVHRKDRGKSPDFSGQEIETRTVTRTLDEAVFQLPLAEDTAVVSADVVDRAPAAVFAVPEAQALAIHLDHSDFARWDIRRIGDGDVTGQAAAPSTSAMRPMRGASALITRARTCTSGMSFTTRWKNPRTRSCSAVERSSPRDMM
jgi:hypothetical protein